MVQVVTLESQFRGREEGHIIVCRIMRRLGYFAQGELLREIVKEQAVLNSGSGSRLPCRHEANYHGE